MKDDLNHLLKTWQPEIPEPADFRVNVWKKIELSRSKKAGWLADIFALFAQPKIALATVALAIVVGGAAGWEVSANNQVSTYLRSVDPYARLR